MWAFLRSNLEGSWDLCDTMAAIARILLSIPESVRMFSVDVSEGFPVDDFL